jgi:hypothetical protein
MAPSNSRTYEEKDRTVIVANIEKQDSTFKLKYFKLHGMAWSVRTILAATGAEWESVFPEVKRRFLASIEPAMEVMLLSFFFFLGGNHFLGLAV